MTFAYLGIGVPEMIFIVMGVLFIIAVGNYGRDTQLGYLGSVLLAIITSPIVAFIVIYYLKYREKTRQA
jgi:hypothetical protein